jgi:hypothetical protein
MGEHIPFLALRRVKMDISIGIRILGPFFYFGLILTGFGCYQCVKGHDYRVAAEHEATTVGHIVHAPRGKGVYRYEFSLNGVKMDDSSNLCTTPLTPDACYNYGPVLVYYSYQPLPNSLLEDFAVASNDAYRIGKFLLAIGLPLLVFPAAAFAVRRSKNKRANDSDPDMIHIVPGE